MFAAKHYKEGENKKARLFSDGPCYMDGLVSTGNKFPYTILKIIFSNRKFFMNYFINILFFVVDKGEAFSDRKKVLCK